VLFKMDSVEYLLWVAKNLTGCSRNFEGELPIRFFEFLGKLKNAEV